MNKLKDSITITWHIDDLEDIAPRLTRRQRQEVLAMAKKNHDSAIGISWEVLVHWADFLFPDQGENGKTMGCKATKGAKRL